MLYSTAVCTFYAVVVRALQPDVVSCGATCHVFLGLPCHRLFDYRPPRIHYVGRQKKNWQRHRGRQFGLAGAAPVYGLQVPICAKIGGEDTSSKLWP